MPTLNQIGSGTKGSTGTGAFVGNTGPVIKMARTNNTNIGVAGSTFTLDGVSGQITTASISISNGASADYTWNNSFFTTASAVFCFSANSSAIPVNIFAVTITSNGVATLSLIAPRAITSSTQTFNYLVF